MEQKTIIWNPWHGCRKYSEGCERCYVYRRDESIGKDASEVVRTGAFDLPVQVVRNRGYRVPSDAFVYCCMTSDFFLEEADRWREEIWRMIRHRRDVTFCIITKRIERAHLCLPSDWGEGYENVILVCTVESQRQADVRLPIFKDFPARRKRITCEPLLTRIDLSPYLLFGIEQVVAGGESGFDARPCQYNWVLALRAQCIRANVPFYFKQTGANFVKDGKRYQIPRKYQHSQARRANINTEKRT